MERPLQSLQTACARPDSLFAIPQNDLLRIVYEEFPQDIDRLQRAYSLHNGPPTPSKTPSPSYTLFQSEYDEVNRTLVGFLALRWIHLGEYDFFVSSQPSETQLSKDAFDWIREFYAKTITDSHALYALITSIIINDLGKDPQLAIDYRQRTGFDIADSNHDVILLNACKVGLVPSVQKVHPQYREHLLRGIELGATFNFGQLAQAENAPASLSGLLLLQGNHHVLPLRFMEQILDIAGAAGHMDWTCAKKLNQPIFESYRDVYDACQGVIDGSLDLRGGYDLILTRGAKSLHSKGFRLLQIDQSRSDRALMRLLRMGNATTLEIARLFERTWNSLETPIKEGLIYSLCLEGGRAEPAIQPTYMPAFLSQIKTERALACALRYLFRVMTIPDGGHSSSAVVIERSVLGVLKQVVETGHFQEDPTILERISVPEAVVAQQEWTETRRSNID